MMSSVSKYIFAFFALVLSTATFADDLSLVQDGKPTAIIVVPDRTDTGLVNAQRAAQVLVDHIAQMSGAKLEVHLATDLGNATVENGMIKPEAGRLVGDIKAFILI